MSTEQNQTKHSQAVEDAAQVTASNNQAAPFVEDAAALTATSLLMDAIDDVLCFAPSRLENFPSETILVAAHAVIAKLDAMETTHLEAMRDLQESIDFLGARAESDEQPLKPTAHESEVMYRALEEDYLLNHQAASIDEMDAILRRFKRLAGY